MLDFPNWFAGTVTIAALIGLGTFLYPWLLRRAGGHSAMGAITVMLGFVFYLFDRSMNTPIAASAILATLWASMPAVVGLLLHRLYLRGAAAQDGSAQS